MDEKSEDELCPYRFPVSCAVRTIADGEMRGVFVLFLHEEITLNLGNILQGLSWGYLQFFSTYYIQEWKF